MNTEYMRRAFSLALRGAGHVSPNPLVGAVLVKNERIIGEGYHEYYGGLHAERNALRDCIHRGESPRGAEIYVTLEPCCHHGKQPPCTDALIEAGVSRVYIGSDDPNPAASGKGPAILRAHGIAVTEHVLKEECDALNEIFFSYIQTGLPLVFLKYAMTLDGKIACHTGISRWVTGNAARRHVHEMRNRCAAIMVGVNTVLQDDPLLTCRIPGGRNPVRIVCDSSLRTPSNSRIVETARKVPTILATCCADKKKQEPYLRAGCRILCCGSPGERVDLRTLMKRLGEEQIDSVLLEGGAALAWSALESGIVGKVQAYIAPQLFGGASAKTPVGGRGFDSPAQAVRLAQLKLTHLGDDFLFEGIPLSGAQTTADIGTIGAKMPKETSTDIFTTALSAQASTELTAASVATDTVSETTAPQMKIETASTTPLPE